MPKNSILFGSVYVDKPVIGGNITIYDLSGSKLFEAQNATFRNGVFMVNVVWSWLWGIPKEFSVTVSGGTIGGAPFNGTLTRYIDDYNPDNYYAVNPITTLIAAYKEKNPSLSDAAIERNVTVFLGFPSLVSLNSVIDKGYSSTFFDVYAFTAEADRNGGVNSFISILVGELEQGKTHPFNVAPLVAEEEGGVFSWTAGALGEGALCYFEEMGIGWVMSKLGYKSSEEKENEEIIKQLTEMSSKLDAIDNKLDIVIADLSLLSNKLTAIQNGLADMEGEMKKYIGEVNSYDPLAKIDNAYSDLQIYAKCSPGDVSNDTIREWSSAVLDPTTGIGYALDVFDKFNTGNVLEGEDGLMQIMVDSMANKLFTETPLHYGREYRNNIYSIYQSFTDYFQKVLYYELKGLVLVSEAHHARNETLPVKYYIEDTWKPKIENQISLYTALVEKLVIGLEDILEFPNMGPFPANTPNWYNDVYKCYYGVTYPSVAEIFPVADRFTDSLFNGTGKFTIRVLYSTVTNPNQNPADPKPTFQSLDSGKQYKANSTLKSIPVLSSSKYVIYYRTYDLGTVPAGRYKLVSPNTISTNTDVNGWAVNFGLTSNEYWSFEEGIQNSLRGTFQNGLVSSSIGTIQVTADEDGHPYGYWGGQWFDKSLPNVG